MTECVYCGTDTLLNVSGVPVCLSCSKDLEAGRKPSYREHRPPKANPDKG